MTEQKYKRFSIQLRMEVYQMLQEMAFEQGIGVSTVVSQIVTRNVYTQKKLVEAMSNPETIAELTKVIGMLENKKD